MHLPKVKNKKVHMSIFILQLVVGLQKGVDCLINMNALLKCKVNLTNYLRNHL